MTKSVINHDEELLSQAESIVYKQPDDGSDLHAHIYFPPGEREGASRPALVFFFASGWDNGRVSQFAPQALHFANRGAVTILIEYRTRTSHDASPIASMQDARSALRWVRFYSDQLGVDPCRIVAIGALVGSMVLAGHGGAVPTASPELVAVVAGGLAVRRSGNVLHAFAVGLPVMWLASALVA